MELESLKFSKEMLEDVVLIELLSEVLEESESSLHEGNPLTFSWR